MLSSTCCHLPPEEEQHDGTDCVCARDADAAPDFERVSKHKLVTDLATLGVNAERVAKGGVPAMWSWFFLARPTSSRSRVDC